MVTICWIEVRENTNLNLSTLSDGSSLCIQHCMFVTESVEFLDSQLSFELIEDDDIMIVWIETSPIIIVRTYESPCCVHHLVH